jgi:membrane-associated phospholipid phosphatase
MVNIGKIDSMSKLLMSKFKFQIFQIRWQSAALFTLGTILFTAPYLISNEINAHRQEHIHLYWQWEFTYIPFVSWMLIPYVSVYFVPILTLAKLQWHENKALVCAVGISGFIGAILFLLFPTVLGFERNIAKAGAWAPLYEILWRADRPHNLCPSMHVVMAYLLVMPMIKKIKTWLGKMALYFLFVMICLSILFTHQHHAIDLVFGLVLGWISDLYIYRPLCLRFAREIESKKVIEQVQDKKNAA